MYESTPLTSSKKLPTNYYSIPISTASLNQAEIPSLRDYHNIATVSNIQTTRKLIENKQNVEEIETTLLEPLKILSPSNFLNISVFVRPIQKPTFSLRSSEILSTGKDVQSTLASLEIDQPFRDFKYLNTQAVLPPLEPIQFHLVNQSQLWGASAASHAAPECKTVYRLGCVISFLGVVLNAIALSRADKSAEYTPIYFSALSICVVSLLGFAVVDHNATAVKNKLIKQPSGESLPV